MFNFDQPKLKLRVAYTRRDTWMNEQIVERDYQKVCFGKITRY